MEGKTLQESPSCLFRHIKSLFEEIGVSYKELQIGIQPFFGNLTSAHVQAQFQTCYEERISIVDHFANCGDLRTCCRSLH